MQGAPDDSDPSVTDAQEATYIHYSRAWLSKVVHQHVHDAADVLVIWPAHLTPQDAGRLALINQLL